MSFIIIKARIIQPSLKPTIQEKYPAQKENVKGTKLRDVMYGALSL